MNTNRVIVSNIQRVYMFKISLNKEISKKILHFLEMCQFNDEDYGQLIDKFPFEASIQELANNITEVKKYQKEHGDFDVFHFDVFRLLSKSYLYKHTDRYNNFSFKLVIWFVSKDLNESDGGALKFYHVEDHEIEYIQKNNIHFNADTFYKFETEKLIKTIIPSLGSGIAWDNLCPNLLHEVSPLKTKNKRYSVTLCLGYKDKINYSC